MSNESKANNRDRKKSVNAPVAPNGRATLKTISEMTGLSLSTVSLSLRDGSMLKKETRERVAEAARAVGYVPNRAGVRLRTGRTSVIALVLDSGGHSVDFTQHLIAGVGEGVSGTRYHVTIAPEYGGNDSLDTIRYILENRTADGVIITHTSPNDRRVQLLTEANFPFVCHGRTEFFTPHAYHDFHSEAFAKYAVDRLVSMGCKRLLLAHAGNKTMNYHNILTSFRTACAQSGVIGDVNDRDLISIGGFDEVRRMGRELAKSDCRPDGIICNSELYAISLFGGLQDAGVQMGRDVKLVCKQTSDLLPIVFPHADGIEEDVEAAGKELATLLLRRIEGEPVENLQTLGEPILHWRCPVEFYETVD